MNQITTDEDLINLQTDKRWESFDYQLIKSQQGKKGIRIYNTALGKGARNYI
jgi:hypothetical protein